MYLFHICNNYVTSLITHGMVPGVLSWTNCRLHTKGWKELRYHRGHWVIKTPLILALDKGAVSGFLLKKDRILEWRRMVGRQLTGLRPGNSAAQPALLLRPHFGTVPDIIWSIWVVFSQSKTNALQLKAIVVDEGSYKDFWRKSSS